MKAETRAFAVSPAGLLVKSAMGRSACRRLALGTAAIGVLWLAIVWAVSLP